MAELVTIHKTAETQVPKIMAYLEDHDLHPEVVDDTEEMGFPDGGAHEVRIGVPAAERDMATRILEQMQQEEELRALPAIKRADATFSRIVAVMVVLVLALLFDTGGTYFVVIQIGLIAVVAMIAIQQAWGGKSKASSARRKPDQE